MIFFFSLAPSSLLIKWNLKEILVVLIITIIGICLKGFWLHVVIEKVPVLQNLTLSQSLNTSLEVLYILMEGFRFSTSLFGATVGRSRRGVNALHAILHEAPFLLRGSAWVQASFQINRIQKAGQKTRKTKVSDLLSNKLYFKTDLICWRRTFSLLMFWLYG